MFAELAKFFGIKTSKKTVTAKTEAGESGKNQKSPVSEDIGIVKDEPESIQVKKTEQESLEPAPLPAPSKKKGYISVKAGKKTKNGLPVLSDNFDFKEAFGADTCNKPENISCSDPVPLPESAKKIRYEINPETNHEITEQHRQPSLIQEKQPTPEKNRKPAEIWTDRKGIPRLSSDHDLEKLMLSGIGGNDDTDAPEKKPEQAEIRKKKMELRDRNKVPFIPDNIDLAKTFGSDPENVFQNLLHKNLSGKSGDMLLREKKQKKGTPAPVPVEQRIKRYPAPQEDLDLHGFTAIEADRKTDIFIRSARKRDLFTVRIIVGKGLHSQGRAVLPDIVEDRLAALKNEKEVLTFRWEKRQKTKSGAVIVYLNHFD